MTSACACTYLARHELESVIIIIIMTSEDIDTFMQGYANMQHVILLHRHMQHVAALL